MGGPGKNNYYTPFSPKELRAGSADQLKSHRTICPKTACYEGRERTREGPQRKLGRLLTTITEELHTRHRGPGLGYDPLMPQATQAEWVVCFVLRQFNYIFLTGLELSL